MKSICLGEIIAAHGIKGHVKIRTYTENPTDITRYGVLRSDNGTSYTLGSTRMTGPDMVVSAIQGVIDRTVAETLKGIKLYISRDQLPLPPQDEYYHEDLVGLTLLDQEKKEYGTVIGLQDFGAGVFLDIKSSEHEKIITLPFNKDSILSVDLENKKIIIDPVFLLV